MIYLSLFTVFFRIGLFGFGGGLAMLPLIFQSVQEFGIMSAEEFSNLVALSQVTPGPLAVNAATYVGFTYAGIGGSVVATFAVSLPSFILVILVMKFVQKFENSKIVTGILAGIKPAVVGLIGAAFIFVAETVLVEEGSINWIPIALFLVTAIAVGKFKINPIILIIIMGTIGAFTCG